MRTRRADPPPGRREPPGRVPVPPAHAAPGAGAADARSRLLRTPVPGVSNRALAAMARAPRAVLARYDTGEHAQFGTDRVVYQRGNVAVTESDMLVMGDLYERPEDLFGADLDELRELVRLTRQDREHYLGKPVKGVSNAQWEKATPKGAHRRKTYLDLAKENDPHFAPRPGARGKGDHKAEWERLHRQALDIAHAAKTPADKQRAEAVNAFAGHFLTDAFSSGHLINKQDVKALARRNWDRQETFFDHFKETVFTRAVARRLLAHKTAGPKLRQYRLRLLVWRDIDEERLSELLWQIPTQEAFKEQFFDSFVKVVHDFLNVNGIEVDNARGDGPWTLYGDQFLAKGADKHGDNPTLRIGQAAFQESWVNLMTAEASPGPLDYPGLFKNVWDYVPAPLKSEQQRVDQLIAKLADPSTPESIYYFSEMVADHIDDMIDMLHDPEVDRLATPKELHKRAQEMMVPAM